MSFEGNFSCFQDVIRKYTEASPNGKNYAALSSALGTLTWEKPLSSEFEQLARYMILVLLVLSD